MKVFADTFYYLAFLDPNDSYHNKAVSLTLELEATVVTTAWVFSELGSALSAPGHRSAFVRLVDELRNDPEVIVYEADRTLFDQGLHFYRERADKSWSLTDCISFVVMEHESIKEALTGDRHFVQAGFKMLL